MISNKWYKTTTEIKGPLLVVEKTTNVGYGEICKIKDGSKEIYGQVLEVHKDKVIIQVFDTTMGLNLDTKVKFLGESAKLGVSKDMIGKIFDGMGNSLTDKTHVADEYLDINGSSLNPVARRSPSDFIETGISTIDCMTTLVRGQKLPIFSASGLPHNELAAQIVRQAKVKGSKEKFVVVFAGMGITNEEANFFLNDFKKTGAIENTVVFMNTADRPSVERIMTPRVALTTAEYLAFKHNMHVLVVLTDFTNYCESLREISSAREEVPGRRGYPGYMYTDLAQNYERAGMVKGSKGTVTQIPILTMPSGDRTHPIPDLTGYITEGQIVLDSGLLNKSIFPPINPLPSLSRLMGNGVGEGKTRDDHKAIKDQLYATYAQSLEIRQIVSVIGEGSLSPTDKLYLEFANTFEQEFINQGFDKSRDIQKTLDIAWKLLGVIPKIELKKLNKKLIDKYMKK